MSRDARGEIGRRCSLGVCQESAELQVEPDASFNLVGIDRLSST